MYMLFRGLHVLVSKTPYILYIVSCTFHIIPSLSLSPLLHPPSLPSSPSLSPLLSLPSPLLLSPPSLPSSPSLPLSPLLLSPPLSSDYKEYHTDTTVRFVVTLSAAHMSDAEAVGLHKKFKLESAISTNNMVRQIQTCRHNTLVLYVCIAGLGPNSLKVFRLDTLYNCMYRFNFKYTATNTPKNELLGTNLIIVRLYMYIEY